jgi:hypothetical protein
LLDAQVKLQAIRSALGASNRHRLRDGAQRLSPTPTKATPIKTLPLPAHLGWGSDPLSNSIRRCQGGYQGDESQKKVRGEEPFFSRPPHPIRCDNWKQPDNDSSTQVVKLFPDIALAFLRHKLAAVARIWLLLKHLDSMGTGWVTEIKSRARLSGKASQTKVCGLRQLRKLLSRGDGIFWVRSGGKIWLRSLPKIAAVLGVTRLVSPPVALPINVLLKSIGSVRAHFYASFHSGRSHSSNFGKPIARTTLRELSAVCSKTQLFYETQAGVKSQFNYAIGGAASSNEIHEHAWKHGRALFFFTDKKGLLGPAGQSYTAWQLPNTYVGPHKRQPKGRRNRINRELADLFQKGMTGNDRCPGKSDTPVLGLAEKRYFNSGSTAVSAFNRDPDDDLYWSTGSQPAGSRGHASRSKNVDQDNHCIWHVLPGRDSH